LLHPTSLPGRFGIGDFGDEAHAFVDFLVAGGQSLWQVLPLGPTGYGNSPYQALSAFAGNPLLISPQRLVAEGLLTEKDLEAPPAFADATVDYAAAQAFREALLRKAFENFSRGDGQVLKSSLEDFGERSSFWLDDYAVFSALKNAHGGIEWSKWPRELADRQPAALEKARTDLREEIEQQKFYQFLFFRQWQSLRGYCHQRGVRLIGDIPIFVAHDSVDVWSNRKYFKLDQNGRPTVVAGVPPDYFSKTGQLWGNPLYDWERLKADGFEWWIQRARFALELFDFVRLDHFRGFASCWEIPPDEPTAEHGQWVAAPGQELFSALTEALGNLPLIAENLGVITPDVESLREKFGFPGMRVLQFAFGNDSSNPHLPHNYKHDVVVYTGTHDNDTTVGWFAGLSRETETATRNEREFCLEYLQSDGRKIYWDLIRAALESVADTAIIPLQDVLGLGSEARMNLPASTSGNWTWRFKAGMLTDELAGRLKELTKRHGRISP
jgi:4-alpha-glucanotransferase